MRLSYDHSFISGFCWYMGEPFCSCNFFLSIYPSSYSILILWFFFLKNYFDSESWRKKFGWTGEKKKYSDLTFSQYNHIQNFEDKKLFQHFANLIKIRSTHLLPIFYLFFWSLVYVDLIIHPGGYTVLPLSVCPSVLPRYFSSHFSQQLLWQKSDIFVTSFI